MVRVPSPESTSRIRRRVASLLIVCACSALLLSACGRNHDSSSSSSPSASGTSAGLSGPEETVALYRANCISCHGAELQGMMGDASDLRKVGAHLTKEQIQAQIVGGGSLMPPFKDKLSEAEVESLAEWLAGQK
ncbi:c-type cytochrome [Cohnella fermenti]|uniref:Cytochrome c n=1 Tax=Cohnella fermenti TaxID=2565925 RepID=A0A4S4BER1_9BACL|nr:cytochrome c [Cohnella fermenti]THF72659.1 cytochrome c [Cohnella fermenti]